MLSIGPRATRSSTTSLQRVDRSAITRRAGDVAAWRWDDIQVCADVDKDMRD
jgi:hypothetical protein